MGLFICKLFVRHSYRNTYIIKSDIITTQYKTFRINIRINLCFRVYNLLEVYTLIMTRLSDAVFEFVLWP